MKGQQGKGGGQRKGVTDKVNSCLRPSNTSLDFFFFASFVCLFNKELTTSRGQILKNIHYFFFFFFSIPPLSSSSCFGDC